MKVYIAGNPRNSRPEIEYMMKSVVDAGHQLTWNWLVVMDQDKDNDRSAAHRFNNREYAAAMDQLGVVQADVLILIDSAFGRGMYTELGIALASTKCKKVIVVTDPGPGLNIFYHLPKVVCVAHTYRALEVLEDIAFIEGE